MKPNMKNKIKILISVVLLLASTITITYMISKKNKEEIPETNTYISEVIEDECTEEYINEQNTTAVSSNEEKVAANAILILKKYYIQCDHTINEYVELPQELVNMTKEEVQAQYPDWEVIGFEAVSYTHLRAHETR